MAFRNDGKHPPFMEAGWHSMRHSMTVGDGLFLIGAVALVYTVVRGL